MTESSTTPEGGDQTVPALRGVDTPASFEAAFLELTSEERLAAVVEARAAALRQEHYAHLVEAEANGAPPEVTQPTEADITPVALALIEDAQRFKFLAERLSKGAQFALDAVGEDIESAGLSVKERSGHRFTEPGTGTTLTVGVAGSETNVWDLDPILQAVTDTVVEEAIEAGRNDQPGGITADEVDAYRRGAYEALKTLRDYAKIEPKVNPVKALAKDLRKRGKVALAVGVEASRSIVWSPRGTGGFSLTRDTRTSK